LTSSRISSVARADALDLAARTGIEAGFSISSSQEVASTINGVRSSWLTSLVNSRSGQRITQAAQGVVEGHRQLADFVRRVIRRQRRARPSNWSRWRT
jgi:hypothetical protein